MPPAVPPEIQELEERSSDGECLYRGQPQFYSEQGNQVFSSLERVLPKIPGGTLTDLEAKIRLGAASFYTPHTQEIEIKADLRHFHGLTNLIDFTRDPRIALFFACLEEQEKDGRVFCRQIDSSYPFFDEGCYQSALHDWPWAGDIEICRNFHIASNAKRAIRQSSVLVRSPSGDLDFKEDEIYCIPKERKQDILAYLAKLRPPIALHHLFADKEGLLGLGLKLAELPEDFEKNLNARLAYRSEQLQGAGYYGQGKNHFFHGRYEEATDHFLAALRKPDKGLDFDFYRFLSSAWLRTSRPEDALDSLAQIPRNNWEGQDYYMSALGNKELGELQEALEDIKRAIDANPLRSIYYITRILIIQQIGDDKALSGAIQRYQVLFHSKYGENSPLGQD